MSSLDAESTHEAEEDCNDQGMTSTGHNKQVNVGDESTQLSSSESDLPQQHDEPVAPPPAKFKVMDKVYARDEDGVVYLAVIRRSLYGKTTNKQCKMGYISIKEAKQLEKTEEEKRGYYDDSWHYYVHYDGWNVKWDRWVLEGNIYPAEDDKIKEYAARLSKEHKELRQSMMKKPTKGKKAWQTLDPSAFLHRWRLKVDEIDAEMGVSNAQLAVFRDEDFYDSHHNDKPKEGGNNKPKEGENKEKVETKASKDKKKPKPIDQGHKKRKMEASLELEKEFRSRGLTKRRNLAIANKIAIPNTLQKVLVDQWEIVCQCGMVPVIPAPITVRGALNKYLSSRGVVVETESSSSNATNEAKSTNENQSTSEIKKASALANPLNEDSKDKGTTSPDRVLESSEGKNTGKIDAEGTEPADASNGDSAGRIHQDLVEMATGVAMFFDDAIRNLLYKEEQAQFREVSTNKEFKGMRCSDLYGTEHLLRLFVRLPEILEAHLPLEETRPMLAKVNDFVRFLGKNQDSLFPLKHERPPPPPQKRKPRQSAPAPTPAPPQPEKGDMAAQEKTEGQ